MPRQELQAWSMAPSAAGKRAGENRAGENHAPPRGTWLGRVGRLGACLGGALWLLCAVLPAWGLAQGEPPQSAREALIKRRQAALDAVRSGDFGRARQLLRQSAAPATIRGLLREMGSQEREGVLFVEASVKQVLQLTLQLSATILALRISEESQRRTLVAVEKRLQPTWSNTLGSGRGLNRGGGGNGGGSDALRVNRPQTQALTSSFSHPLRSGLRYGVSLTDERTESDTLNIATPGASPEVEPAATEERTTRLRAEVNIPLAQDWGAVNTAPERKAKSGLHAALHTLREQELRLLGTMGTLYWNLVGAQESVKARKEALALSERLLLESEARFEAGVASRTVVLSARTQLASDRRQLLVAQASVRRIQDSARAALNLQSLNVGLIPKDRFTEAYPAYAPEDFKDRVLRNSAALGQLRAQLRQSELATEENINRLRPDLDLNLSYSYNGFADGGSATPEGGEFAGYEISLTWNLPLYDEPDQENLAAGLLNTESMRLQLRDQESALLVELQSLLRDLEVSQQDIQAARELSGLAKAELDNEIVRFRQGQGTSTSVARLQKDFSEARVSEILARVAYEKQHLAFLAMTGELYAVFELSSPMRAPPP